MQGGRGESSVLGRLGALRRGELDDSSGYESEVEVTESISLGYLLDEALHAARSAFAVAISLPIAWLTLHPSIGAFRERKFRVVSAGTQTVLALQKRLRCRVLDIYFGIFSFFAEEEFYLLVLPFLIWNVDRVLGRRLTLLVTLGLMAGNTMKDVFALPRPSPNLVWRPAHQEAIDSTSLQDFGFPSTHAMNALSNSVFTLLYLTTAPGTEAGFAALTEPRGLKMVAGCVVYVTSLCVSRLYLGAHTPTDVRGGLALGAVWTAVYFASSEQVDAYIMTTPALLAKLLLAATVALLLNPQPRPPTPTFAQNALLAGLVIGTALGSRHYADIAEIDIDATSVRWGTGLELARELGPAGPALAAARAALAHLTGPWAGFVRTVLGYAVVILLRVCAKSAATAVLWRFGISTKPSPEKDSGKPLSRRRHLRVVRLFTRDVDIIGNALVKVFTYAVLAWAITFLVPVLHISLALAEYQPDVAPQLAAAGEML